MSSNGLSFKEDHELEGVNVKDGSLAMMGDDKKKLNSLIEMTNKLVLVVIA